MRLRHCTFDEPHQKLCIARIKHGRPSPSQMHHAARPLGPAFVKETLDRLGRSGVQLGIAKYASLLKACRDAEVLSDGKIVHKYIVQSGQERSAALGGLLVQVYGNCGALEDARLCFAEVQERDMLVWNLMIGALVSDERGKEALQLVQQMQWEGVIPDKFTFVTILSACARLFTLAEGKRMHVCIRCNGLESDVVIGTALLSMYSKCGRLDDAWTMFDKMPKKNEITWNAIISANVQHGHVHKACWLFEQMLEDVGIINKVTFLTIINACVCQAALAEGRRMHINIVRNGFGSDVVFGSALLNMYSKCGSFEDAQRMIDKMPERDVVLWTSIITICCDQGNGKAAQQLFDQMKQEGVLPDKVTFLSVLDACGSKADIIEGRKLHTCMVKFGLEWDVMLATSLINMYGKSCSFGDAGSVFDALQQRNVVSWNAMLAAYGQHGKGNEMFQLFRKMQCEGVNPSYVTFLTILDLCVRNGAVVEGKKIHILAVCTGFESNINVEIALVNMYSKCGSLEDAQRVFKTIQGQNVVSWTAMISAAAQHGLGKIALELFAQMQHEGISPDRVTFVSILFACSHVGLVDEASHWLNTMIHGYGIRASSKHYDCLIDLLGRAGRLEEAEELIGKMPFSPSVVTWTTLLASCRTQIDVERGERAARHMFRMDPKNSAPYVALYNIYSVADMMDDAENVIFKMKARNLSKL